MKNLKIICMLLVLVMMFSIVASSKGDVKDTLIAGMISDAVTLDPHRENDTDSEQALAMIYSTLFKFGEEGTIVNDLVESYELSEDKLTWSFKLKEGVKFHNGKELMAEDVKGTYGRFMADTADAFRLYVKGRTEMFESVDIVDKYTVSITTKEPYGPMKALLADRRLSIMDHDVIAQFGAQTGDFPESAIGTGPFRIVSWKKNEELVFERFDDYFGENAKIKTVKIRTVLEAASRVIALETGEIDLIKQIPAEDLDRFKADPNFNVVQRYGVGTRLFRFGCNDPIISNAKVRQAIVYAIDRDEIVEGLFPGVSYLPTGPITPAVWGYYNFGEMKQDQEKAKQLLTEAGYPNGFDTKIVTTPRYDKGIELAEVLSAQLSEVGINAEIEVLEWSVILQMWLGLTPEEFDQPIFIMGAGDATMDADGAFRDLYTTTKTGTNESNYGFYSNAEFDQLIYEGMKETDPEKRYDLYKRAQEILYLEDPAQIVVFGQLMPAVSRSNLKGVDISAINNLNFEKMYFE